MASDIGLGNLRRCLPPRLAISPGAWDWRCRNEFPRLAPRMRARSGVRPRQRSTAACGWPYRFEADTPASRRKFGDAATMPGARGFQRELKAELERMQTFLL